jgi:signal transduction histidine kinase/ActR/RegA family two-component response regulator
MQAAAPRRPIQYLGLAFGGLVGAMLAVTTVVWVNIDLIQHAGSDVAEAQGELAWADATLDAADDEQNALSGISATHDRRYLAPFELGQQRFEHAFARLTAYALDDPPDQRRDVATAGRLARTWALVVAQPEVAATEAGRVSPAPPRAELDGMIQVARVIDDLRDAQERLLAQRERVLAGAYGATRAALVMGSTAALAFVLAILALAARQLLVDRRRAEDAAQRLSEALQRAQSAERTKTRFLANMSHEMHTPLNGVVGMTEALAHTQLDPTQRELIDAIGFSASTLDHLIRDLISVSRDGIATRIVRTAKTFRLGAAVRAMALPFGLEAAAIGVAFAVEVEPAADIQVTGDAGVLSELLACLLSNAVKFTDHGEVCVSVRRLGEAAFGVEVSDTGVGFDAAQQARMFEAFSQEDDSDTRRFGGAGLGLAVARRLAEEMGGTLAVRSTPGEGSVFSLAIELAVASADAESREIRAPAEEEEEEEAEAALRVLIVDDNPVNRRVLELILDQFGVDWVSVGDGQQAVDAVRAQPFTAILMDIQMPVMDGLTATREIRRIEREADRPAAPVIIVSASCEPEHLEAGRAAGAQRHLGKPVSAQALIEALNEVLADTAQAA